MPDIGLFSKGIEGAQFPVKRMFGLPHGRGRFQMTGRLAVWKFWGHRKIRLR
jgi:hypothetical protein